MFNELKHVQNIKRNQDELKSTSIDDLTSCEDKIRPVANHRRQSINKAHPIQHLQLSKKRLRSNSILFASYQTLLRCNIQNFGRAPLFFPLDVQTKGGFVVGTTHCKSSCQVVGPIGHH